MLNSFIQNIRTKMISHQKLIMPLPEIYQYFLYFCMKNHQKLVLLLMIVNKTMHTLSITLFDNIWMCSKDKDIHKFIFHYIKYDFFFAVKRMHKQYFSLEHITNPYSMQNEKFFRYFISSKSEILDHIEKDFLNVNDLDYELLKNAIEYCCPNIIICILENRTNMDYSIIYNFFNRCVANNRIDILDCFLNTNVVTYNTISYFFDHCLYYGNTKMVKYFLRKGVITKKTINLAFRKTILIISQNHRINLLIPYVTKNYIQICLNELFSKNDIDNRCHYAIKIILKYHPCMKNKLIKMMEKKNIYSKHEILFE